MGVLRRILGRDRPTTNPPVTGTPRSPTRGVYVLPRDSYFAVHGESFHQGNIEALLATCAPHPDEDDRPACDVLLRAEPTNPVDPNAIAVHATTGHVGYLPRDVAPDFGRVFAELHQRGYTGASCGALITGGTPDKPSRGVVLLLGNPDACLRHINRSHG